MYIVSTLHTCIAAKCIGFVSSPPPYLSLLGAASCGGGLLVPTALTIGVSYASGGAGILDSTV
jgi:hypothetical protein